MAGCVYKRGNVFWIKYHRDGRAYYENSHTAVKTEAKKLLQDRLGDIAEGIPVTAKITQCRVDEILDDVARDYERNGRKTLDKVQSRIKNHLLPFFGGLRASSVTGDDVLRFQDERRKAGAANAEVNRELAILKRGYKLGIQAGKLLRLPTFAILNEDNVRQGYFEREQFEAVRAALPDYLRPLVTFAYLTGWRTRSETQPLRWAQIDFDAGMVRLEVGTTKNKRGRLFPFNALPELRELLERQRTETTAFEKAHACVVPYVFHHDGQPIRDFYGAWDTACWRVGLGTKDPETGKIVTTERIPHDFRRTAVRNLVRAGISEGVAMKLTGHKTAAVFRRYDIIVEQDLIEGVEKLAAGPVVTKQLQTGTIRRLRAHTGSPK